GVNRGEYQVSGQCSVNGDLSGFVVADFADQNLVRIVAKDRSQPAREGQTLLLVHRDLGDAANLVFHGIFDGDDLVFVVLDLAQRRVKRRSFARAGRSGDQHHAIRLFDVAPELRQLRRRESDHVERKIRELLAHRFFVEYAKYRVFAIDRRHDGDAEIDQPG